MTGINKYVKASAVPHWVRNPLWPDMPTLSPGDNKMYGLYAVYEHLTNEITVRFTTTNNVGVIWGDGESTSVPTVTDITHTYVYSALIGTVLQDAGGYDYKTVMVEIPFSSTTSAIISRAGTTDEQNASSKWLDIIIDNSDITLFYPSENRKTQFIERIKILNHSFSMGMNSGWGYLENLKVLEGMDFAQTTNASTMFNSVGDVLDSNGNILDFNLNNTSTVANAFQYSTIKNIGDVSFTAATNAFRMFINSTALETIGDIDASAATTMGGMFQECRKLRKIGTITTTSAMTSINSTFRFTVNLEDATITDCSGITDAANAFVFTTSYKNIILSGLTESITVAGNDMDANAINNLFTSLGDGTAETITVTDNPGASSADTSIATAKNWTVVT